MKTKNPKGITLIELMITTVLLIALGGVATYAFLVLAVSWSGMETRTGADINAARSIDEIVREIRKAKNVASLNDGELRYASDGFYVYYLYNAGDAYPQSFNRPSYELRHTTLSGIAGSDLLTGSFTYGSGRVIIKDVKPPSDGVPVMKWDDTDPYSKKAVIYITVVRDNETVGLKTEVEPRNM